jgi:hypothetical protein
MPLLGPTFRDLGGGHYTRAAEVVKYRGNVVWGAHDLSAPWSK